MARRLCATSGFVLGILSPINIPGGRGERESASCALGYGGMAIPALLMHRLRGVSTCNLKAEVETRRYKLNPETTESQGGRKPKEKQKQPCRPIAPGG